MKGIRQRKVRGGGRGGRTGWRSSALGVCLAVLAACGALAVPTAAGAESAAHDGASGVTSESIIQGESTMGYINPEAPSIASPRYAGQWYEDRIPDTLDIAEMAGLSINCLTGAADPEADYGMYFLVSLTPLEMHHSPFDICQPKFMEALPLLRIASGSDQNGQVDQVWMDHIVKSIGGDGLYHMPVGVWPWVWGPLWGGGVLCKADGTTGPMEGPAPDHFTYALTIGRTIDVLTIYYLRDRNPAWKEMAERMIDGLGRLCVHKEDYAYVPEWAFAPNAKVAADAPMPEGFNALDCVGRLPEALGKYYRVSGYEPARELGGKIARFMRYHSKYYDELGRAIEVTSPDYPEDSRGHFHAHTIGLLSMLEHATAANDREMVEYVAKAYEWYRTQGSSLIGFFPENILRDLSYKTCETCEVADMIALGLKLTEAGAGDYWDDVDRWTRNQFAEAQLKHIGWIARPEGAAGGDRTDRVAERNVGGFAGWASVNEWMDNSELPENWEGEWMLMHCCTGNAARTLYYIWEHMLEASESGLRVNLLMNRASDRADVYSHVPYAGRVDVKVKQACESLQVRMPEWVAGGDEGVACEVNGSARDVRWRDRYVELGPLSPGDLVTVTFPIGEWQTTEEIAGKEYTFTLKGSTVVWVDPPGERCPIYQRRKYQQHSHEWRTVRRFVSSERVEW